MPPKRASEDDPQLVHKIQRIEHGVPASPPQRMQQNTDFSVSVKRKLADSKRTGQACDRCKVRTNVLSEVQLALSTASCSFATRHEGSNLCASSIMARIASCSRERCAQDMIAA